MRVKCVLCDMFNKIDDESPLAKKLRNRPIHTYMCLTCHSRIKSRTEERRGSNDFVEYSHSKSEDNW